ncbi:MAG: 4Fe-4S binding protein [Anaerolineae bacterium]|jgi:heterodisulfide reductase subunit A
MIPVTIDGQRIEVEEGTTILEAAQRLGIHIPALCHHPALEPYGACRQCTVEIRYNGRSRLVTSCNYPIRWEIEVQTASDKVLEGRKLLAELLLARCPSSPEVQEIAARMGVTKVRFEPGLEDELCYLCGLCVRVCEELIGQSAISFVGRGVDREVGSPFYTFSEACIACGACAFVCPTGAIKLEDITDKEPQPLYSEFDVELSRRGSIFIPFDQAVPKIPVIDREHCLHHTLGRCGTCEYFCEADAIDYDQEDELLDLNVGTVVVATGFDMWDPTQLPQYSYGESPNILTGLQFERLTSANGPTEGKIVTDEGKVPESVAIIHCIGSRDENAHKYCSRFCCMYSLKHAHQVRDKTGAEVYDFYMDMRAFGKAYEEFYERVQEEGVTFVRGRGAEVEVLSDGKLRVRGEDADLGRLVSADVDMVILASAIEPQPEADQVAALFGLGRTPDGWLAEAHPKLRPVETTTAGVFLAGCCQGPRDIPDTVAHAGAAALEAVRLFNQGEVTISPIVAEVTEEICAGCGECILACPYSAIDFNSSAKAEVNAALCHGCGTCVATCPSGAITEFHFTDQEIVAQIDGLLAMLA